MMRLHIIVGALLLAPGAFAQKATSSSGTAASGTAASGTAASAGKQTPVKLKLPPLPPSTDAYLVAQLADAHWTPAQKIDAKLPAGAEFALIGADPTSTGVTMYLRTKGGYKVPLHWQTHLEYDTVIAGKGTIVVDGKKIAAAPGTFVIIPSKAKRELSCDAGAECVLLVRRSGPTDYNWLAK